MAQVTVNWTPNPAEEQVSLYKLYVDDVVAATTPTPPVNVDIPAGAHKVELSASNVWGEGPKSDPVLTPPAASKPAGVSITINVTVNL